MLFRRYFFASLIFFCGCSLISSSCPTQKVGRKSQKLRLEVLAKTDVVVESLYQGTTNGYHWFLIEQVWKGNNGDLKPGENIYVDISSNAPYWQCFRKLYLDESYILMLEQMDASRKIYRPLEPPVFSYHKKLREAIWERLCSLEENSFSSCEMRITLPERVVYYQGQVQSLKCKVDSSFPVTEVSWFKDDTKIVTNAAVGLSVDTNEKDYSVVTFNSISAMHVGNYKCLVTNAEGEQAQAITNVQVAGPLKLSHFEPCDEPNYCHNAGVCRQMRDGRKRCECPKYFHGDRCAGIVIEPVMEDQTYEDMKQTVFHLTTAVTAVSITLFFVLVLSLIFIARIRKKRSQEKDKYDEVELSTLQTNRETTQEGSHSPPVFSPKSCKSLVRVFVEDTNSIEFRATPMPSPNPSLKTKRISEQQLIENLQNINSSPRTPSNRLTSGYNPNIKQSLSRPVTPCSNPGSPYSYTKRERLYGKS